MSRPSDEPSDLATMFRAIPKLDAVPRPAPRMLRGLAGWGRRQRVAWLVGSVALFLAYGGLAALGTPGVSLLVSAAAAMFGGFIAASYVPAPGGRLSLSPCSVMPLLWTVGFAPWAMAGDGGMNSFVTAGLLGVFAVQRASGAGCGV